MHVPWIMHNRVLADIRILSAERVRISAMHTTRSGKEGPETCISEHYKSGRDPGDDIFYLYI